MATPPEEVMKWVLDGVEDEFWLHDWELNEMPYFSAAWKITPKGIKPISWKEFYRKPTWWERIKRVLSWALARR